MERACILKIKLLNLQKNIDNPYEKDNTHSLCRAVRRRGRCGTGCRGAQLRGGADGCVGAAVCAHGPQRSEMRACEGGGGGVRRLLPGQRHGRRTQKRQRILGLPHRRHQDGAYPGRYLPRLHVQLPRAAAGRRHLCPHHRCAAARPPPCRRRRSRTSWR